MEKEPEYDPNEKFKIPQVPFDTLIDISISGAFLQRCQSLLIGLSEQMGKQRLDDAFKKFKDSKEEPADIEEATLFVITAIVGEAESQAMKQKKTVEIELTREQIGKMVYGESTNES